LFFEFFFFKEKFNFNLIFTHEEKKTKKLEEKIKENERKKKTN
jgi:hypothetical protein